MTFGIGLVFDPQTEAHIKEVWCTLARQGFATPLARPGCLPHVSLILSETLRVDDLARDLDELGHSPRRLEVRISHVGVFTEPEIVLFYGVTPTSRLLRFHAEVERRYRRWSSGIMARSRSGVWVPHCTLAGRVEASRLSEAIATAATPTLPWVANQVRLAIVQFDQVCVELLRVFPWQGSPVRRRMSPVRRAGEGCRLPDVGVGQTRVQPYHPPAGG
jgi:2'-5' RNA ligase